MKIIYRITSIPSTNPSPIFQDNKNELNRICLLSFFKAFVDVKPEIIFLADHCDCRRMIEQLCVNYNYDYQIIETNHGINEAMKMSYDIAKDMNDYVLFQECDYFYQPRSGALFLEALKRLKLLSPYDHPNFYIDKTLHSNECKIELIENRHFRSTERNTMTWACHSDMVKKNLEMLKSHGYLDGQVWYDLLEKGYQLYVPIPSIATHMAKDWIAKGVDWKFYA